jgi:flagellar motor protein MotB
MSEAEKIENKKEKKKAKYDRSDEQEQNIVCTSYHQKGHNNARSPLCSNRKLTKQEELQQLMGNRKTTTVKTKLETIPRPAHRSIKDKIIKVSKDIRSILVRIQLFVNYYIMSHNGLVVDKKLFT